MWTRGRVEEVNRNVTIRVDRADLAGALSMVRRSVPRASHLHGFRHEGVRLRYAGETLEVSATGPIAMNRLLPTNA